MVEDTVVATLEFANGAVGTLKATTSAYPRRVELTGTNGTIILEHDRIVAADLRSPSTVAASQPGERHGPNSASPVISNIQGHKKVLQDFVRAVETDGKPRCDGREGRRSVELVRAIYESSRTGRPVSLS